MTIKPGTLVLVFPENGYPSQMCLGIVEDPIGSDHFWVKIDNPRTPRGIPLQERISIRTDFLRPMAELGEVLRKRSVETQLVKQVPEALLGFALKIERLEQLQKVQRPAEISPGNLVIVDRTGSDGQGEPSWGIVRSEMPGGKFDVTLGPEPMSLMEAATAKVRSGVRFLGRRKKSGAEQNAEPTPRLKTFAAAGELIPYIQTGDSGIVDVRRTVIKNVYHILLAMAQRIAQLERETPRPGPS